MLIYTTLVQNLGLDLLYYELQRGDFIHLYCRPVSVWSTCVCSCDFDRNFYCRVLTEVHRSSSPVGWVPTQLFTASLNFLSQMTGSLFFTSYSEVCPSNLQLLVIDDVSYPLLIPV